jgi:hypothetical protein
MIALRLIRLIEAHCDEIAHDLAKRIHTSSRTSGMRKVSEAELVSSWQELLQHLSEWLMTKTEADVEKRYREIGARRAGQLVPLANSCWAVTMTKEYLWDFLQKQGFLRNPIELYGEMELLSLLDQFFDRAVCFMAEGYEQAQGQQKPTRKQWGFSAAAYVP